MPAAEKNQSQTPSLKWAAFNARNAVCFRALGFVLTTRVVDGSELQILRFGVDHGKFVEIALSDSLAFDTCNALASADFGENKQGQLIASGSGSPRSGESAATTSAESNNPFEGVSVVRDKGTSAGGLL